MNDLQVVQLFRRTPHRSCIVALLPRLPIWVRASTA